MGIVHIRLLRGIMDKNCASIIQNFYKDIFSETWYLDRIIMYAVLYKKNE